MVPMMTWPSPVCAWSAHLQGHQAHTWAVPGQGLTADLSLLQEELQIPYLFFLSVLQTIPSLLQANTPSGVTATASLSSLVML